MSTYHLYVCTDCDWKGQRSTLATRLGVEQTCPSCDKPIVRYEDSDQSWRKLAEASCSLCHRLEAAVDSLCPDCFWLTEIKPRLELRTTLLEAQSNNEAELATRLAKLAPLGRQANGSYRSVLHKCVCGHVETTWLALHCHLQEAGVGHGYILKGEPIAPPARRRQRVEDTRNAWIDDTEDLI